MERNNCHSNCLSCPSCPMSVFKELLRHHSDKLSENKSVTHFKRGETLFHQGLPSFGIYCVERGKVKLSQINEAGTETIFLLLHQRI